MRRPHIPVLADEVITGLHVEPGNKYVDATAGSGGHGVEVVRRGGILLGVDTDPAAVSLARETLEKERKGAAIVVHGNFRDIAAIAREEGSGNVSGVLFDLGVSSMQLDTPERGFSYRFTDAPFDLRMNTTNGETAAQLVNRATEEEVYDVIGSLGEEQLAGSIAHALIGARRVKPIETTGDVVRIIEKLVGDGKRRNAVLSRVFQAFRIAVNDELRSLKEGLAGAFDILEDNGRLVVISFHSLEDRIVKRYMKQGGWQVLTKHPIVAGDTEVQTNPRSRSAKLRIAVKHTS